MKDKRLKLTPEQQSAFNELVSALKKCSDENVLLMTESGCSFIALNGNVVDYIRFWGDYDENDVIEDFEGNSFPCAVIDGLCYGLSDKFVVDYKEENGDEGKDK